MAIKKIEMKELVSQNPDAYDTLVPNCIVNNDTNATNGFTIDGGVLKGGDEIVSRLKLLTSTDIQVESGGSGEFSPLFDIEGGCIKIYWKASLGTGKATYGVSETYINCKSLDADYGFIAAEYNGSKLSVQPKNPQPETNNCEGLHFSATNATGANTVYFNIFKIYKVIE